MEIKAKDLTDEQKEKFVEAFYSKWNFATEADLDSPAPWGCPWLHDELREFNILDIEKEASDYFDSLCSDIAESLSTHV